MYVISQDNGGFVAHPNGYVGAVVYFAKSFDDVKIGYTKDLIGRMRTITCQSGRVLDIKFVIPCTDAESAMAVESFIHHRFSDLRYAGEWFRPFNEVSQRIRNFEFFGDYLAVPRITLTPYK